MRTALAGPPRTAAGIAAFVLLGAVAQACLLPEYERVSGSQAAPAAEPTAGCCSGGPEMGCENAAIAECVCAVDAYCCDSEWDASCAAQIAEYGCGSCGEAPVVDDGSMELEPECATDADCAAGAARCAAGQCVECLEDEHCAEFDAAMPLCGAEGFCGECSDDAACHALYGEAFPSCSLGLCVECVTDAACTADLTCIEGVCG